MPLLLSSSSCVGVSVRRCTLADAWSTLTYKTHMKLEVGECDGRVVRRVAATNLVGSAWLLGGSTLLEMRQ